MKAKFKGMKPYIPNAQLKKIGFFNSANTQYFFEKLLEIGLVKWIDGKNNDVTQPIWSSGCLEDSKTQKMHFLPVLNLLVTT